MWLIYLQEKGMRNHPIEMGSERGTSLLSAIRAALPSLMLGNGQLDDAEDCQKPCVGHASQAGQRGAHHSCCNWQVLFVNCVGNGTCILHQGALPIFIYFQDFTLKSQLKHVKAVVWHQVGSRPSTVVQLMNAVYQEDTKWWLGDCMEPTMSHVILSDERRNWRRRKGLCERAPTLLDRFGGFRPLHGQDVMDDQDYDDITAEVHAEASDISCEKKRELNSVWIERDWFYSMSVGIWDVCAITFQCHLTHHVRPRSMATSCGSLFPSLRRRSRSIAGF